MPTRYIFGTNIAETIYGTDDHDASLAYDEIFYGNGGADIIYAGGGNDWVWASSSDTAGVTFSGQDGDDVLVGFGGNDWLQGDSGGDIIIGGAGNDLLFGETQGYAPLNYYSSPSNDSLWGGNGDDSLYGMLGDDLLIGNMDGESGNDWLFGGIGNDTLIGGGGNDILNGDDGNDQPWGGDGSDQLNGGDLPSSASLLPNSDTLVGGAGPDYLVGGLFDGSRDYLIGGGGADEFTTSGGYWSFRGKSVTNTLNQTDIIWGFELGSDKIKVISNDHGFGLEANYTTAELFDLNTAPGVSKASQGPILGTLLYNGDAGHPVIFIAGQNLIIDQLTGAGSLILG
jgi:Ca2+-binding RTX toxin-like protein